MQIKNECREHDCESKVVLLLKNAEKEGVFTMGDVLRCTIKDRQDGIYVRLDLDIYNDDLIAAVSRHFYTLYPFLEIEIDHSAHFFSPSEVWLIIRITESGLSQISDKPVTVNSAVSNISDRRMIVVIADNGSNKGVGIPHYTMSKANELFKFPANHPIANCAYAMAEVYPDHYIPIAGFHEYFKQTKHAAFIELCASLGAREICIESAEINSQTLDINGDIKTPLSNLGLGISIRENRETGEKTAFRFSEDNKGIKDYDSPWLYTEPSWRSMNNLRRNNHLEELGAEFTCLDEMGINANLTAQFTKVGVNIGGSFQEMTKIRLSYNVIFW